jgi:hypothetical protein
MQQTQPDAAPNGPEYEASPNFHRPGRVTLICYARQQPVPVAVPQGFTRRLLQRLGDLFGGRRRRDPWGTRLQD